MSDSDFLWEHIDQVLLREVHSNGQSFFMVDGEKLIERLGPVIAGELKQTLNVYRKEDNEWSFILQSTDVTKKRKWKLRFGHPIPYNTYISPTLHSTLSFLRPCIDSLEVALKK